MCGIIGYVSNKDVVLPLMEGLKKLEYRGYDSAGITTISEGKLFMAKCKGRIKDLEKLIKIKKILGNIGLGHTRWATHGKPSKINAHPHTDCRGRVIVVHNGIIENYRQLKKHLEKEGCKFKSETDTEVIAHLISNFYDGNLKEAVERTIKLIEGSYALGVISLEEPDKIVVAKYDSPLAIGLGKEGTFVTSDISSVLNYTKKAIYLSDNEIAVVAKNKIDVFDSKGRRILKKIDTISYSIEDIQRGGFPHFMLKEIYEQPEVLSKIISRYVSVSGNIKFESLNVEQEFLNKIDNIIIIACGTAYHAALVGKYIIESYTRIPVWADLGSEFRYRKPIIRPNSVVIAISQSGETADTLAAVREAKKNNVKIISICNVLGSSLTRESDSTIYTYAGPEISVASTKAFTAQVMILYLLGLYLAGITHRLAKGDIAKAISILREIPHKQKEIFEHSKNIKSIARRHLEFGVFLYLGRNINFPIALEGALKLKEISYIPAEGYASGEMKHGPIALIDEYRAVVCIANDSFIFNKMASNIQEMLARRGKIIVVATSGNSQIKDYTKEIIFIPKIEDIFAPLLTIIPLQLLAYHIAALKGFDVDKPRNLAKSVTVE